HRSGGRGCDPARRPHRRSRRRRRRFRLEQPRPDLHAAQPKTTSRYTRGKYQPGNQRRRRAVLADVSRKPYAAVFGLWLCASSVWACSVDYTIWIPRSRGADPLYRFVKGGKAGYIDQAGQVVSPPVLEHMVGNYAGVFYEGLAEIGVSHGWDLHRPDW